MFPDYSGFPKRYILFQTQTESQTMSAIQRASRLVSVGGTNVIPQTESPLVIPHASFAGLALSLSDDEAVVTVAADAIVDGDFDTPVVMEGTGTFLYPNAAGTNILFNAAYVKITWDVGTLQVFQKG